MNINRLKVNRLTNPLGFEMNSLSFSWTVEETDAKKQQWARVEVAADESFQRLLWDSGEDAGLSSVDCPVTLDLQPRTRYWWRVTVQGDNGEQATSAAAWFETSKMGEEWAGKWIAPSLESSVHPLLRRSFFLEGEPVRARVYAVGLGLYELYANGEKAGDEYLAPGCTAYDRWLQYQTYDVTGLLHQGQNTLGAMLGNGWAKGRFGFGGIPASYETGEKGFPAEAFAEQFLLRLELRVLLADGREVVLGTDDTWQCAPSPVTFSSIYDGERYEQAKEIPHWADPEGDGAGWLPVEEVTPSLPLAEPSPRLSLPVRRKEEFHPALLHTKKDEWVLDMGQVITGGFALRANLPQGTELRLQFGELLQDGCFYRDNMRSALCEYRYISDGRPAVVEYLSTDGSARTISTVQAWEWQTSQTESFDPSQRDSVYPAIKDRWAVVVGGSDDWVNYRHQADALAMYQLLRRHGYDDSHIILVMEDNLADNPNNIYPGVVKVRPDGENLYHDVCVDYRLSDISFSDLRDIMLGRGSARLPEVVGSGPQDNVIMFWCGHGNANSLAWGSYGSVSGDDLRSVVGAMHDAGKYRKFFFALDACYSGTIGEACEGVPGLVVMTAANPYEPSKADMKDTRMGLWLSNGFTRAFQDAIDANAAISLRDLYYTCARHTVGSHAMMYNVERYGNVFRNTMAEFLGQ